MEAILILFNKITGYLAILSMFLPIIASIIVRIKKAKLSPDMKLFEGIVYFTVLAQFFSHFAWLGIIEYRDTILSIYLSIHTTFFSYLLLKWTNKFSNPLEISLGILILTLIAVFILSGYNFSADIMLWFNTFVLLALSVYLSSIRDNHKIRIKCEYNFIHNGIYAGSLITAIGIAIPELQILYFGLFIHLLAIIVCNIYFTWSFKCLYH